MLNEIYNILELIKNEPKINEKINIIKQYKGNKYLLYVLEFLYDANITTGINSKENFIENRGIYTLTFNNFMDVLKYVKHNNTGSNEVINNINYYIFSINEVYLRDFMISLITKSYKNNLNYKSVNKAIPNLIKTWEVQLGSPIDKCKIKNGEWFSLTQKLNGNRCSFYKGKLISRQGKEFKGFQHIIDDITACGLQNFFIDGELIGKNTNGLSDGENFRLSTGIINSDDKDKSEIELVVFDIFPSSQFDNMMSELTYKHRITLLEDLENRIKDFGVHNLKVVKRLYQGTDQSQIDKWLQYAVDNDWEGIMLNKDDYYRCKRVTSLCKIKRFYTMDLKVVDVVEGDGRLKGTLGALVVEFKGNTVNVGSGYSDKQRAEIWNNREDIIGNIAEVKYKEITSDKNTGLESLQFPVFVRIRNDKSEPSYN